MLSNLRQRSKKKGISPVIATIILIAVALVLALVVGVFAFGLFSANANTVSLKSANLVAGASSTLAFSLANPGSSAQAIASVTLNNVACTGATAAIPNAGVDTTSCTATTTTVAGNNYNYNIVLTNGQSISGVVVAT